MIRRALKIGIFALGLASIACRSGLHVITKKETLGCSNETQPCQPQTEKDDSISTTESEVNPVFMLQIDLSMGSARQSSNIINDPKPSVHWSVDAAISEVTLMIATDLSCRDLLFTFKQPNGENSRSLEFLSDGTYFICANALDDKGQLITASNNGVQLTLDRTNPLLSGSSFLFFRQPTPTQFTVKDQTSLSYQWSAADKTTALSLSATDVLNPVFSGTTDGTYHYSLSISDAAGNSIVEPVSITWDTTPPFVVAFTLMNEAGDGLIKIGEDQSTAVATKLQVVDYSKVEYSNFVNAQTTPTCDETILYSRLQPPTINSIPAMNGVFVTCARIEDDAGNITYAKSPAITKDLATSQFVSLLGTNGGADGIINSQEYLSPSPLFALTATDYAFAQYTAFADPTTLTCDDQQTYSLAAIPAVSDLPAFDGSYAICVKLIDSSGNLTFGKSQTIIRDITPPTLSTVSLVNEAIDGVINSSESSSNQVPVAISASNYDFIAYSSFLDDSITVTCNSSITYGLSTIPTINNLPSDGIFALCVRLADQAGNIVYGKTPSITRDTLSPTFSNLNAINEASDGYINTVEISSTANLFLLTASGQTTTQFSSLLLNIPSVTCDQTQSYPLSQVAKVNELPASDGIYVQCVKLIDQAGNTTYGKSQSIIKDTASPTLSINSMRLNGGATVTSYNFVQVTLSGDDGIGIISHFCLQVDNTSPPSSSAGCWVAVNAPVPGLTPASTLALNNFDFPIGFVPGTHTIYVWLRDTAGNISSLTNSGTGTIQRDMATINYVPQNPPIISNLLISKTDAPPLNPTPSDLTIPSDQSVYIKWQLTDDTALPATPVSLEYTVDDLNFTTIATNLSNGANGACQIDDPGTTADNSSTGCYVWTNGSPVSTYYKIRVRAIDANNFASSNMSIPINTNNFQILAGNTDSGLNASAVSAIFKNDTSCYYANPDPGSFVVTRKGVIFFRDPQRGLLYVDPNDGLQKVLVPTTGTTAGDGVGVSAATFKMPLKIALDHQDRILVFDYDRIRRIDTTVTPMTISTIIGGGTDQTGDNIAPLAVKFTYPGSYNCSSTGQMPLFALPNGDIYFQSDTYRGSPSTNTRYRVFHAATGLVDSIRPNGTGFYTFDTTLIDTQPLNSLSVVYDPTNSVINYMMMLVEQNVPGNTYRYPSNLNSSTFQPQTPHPPFPVGGTRDMYQSQAMSGRLYFFSHQTYSDRIGYFNPGTNTWTTVAGTGTLGTCADGTLALSCNIDALDVFVTAANQVYFSERGRIRTIDSNGKVVTVVGQSYSYGDGGNTLSARFNLINDIDEINDGRIVVFDGRDYMLREFTVGGTINALAGTGTRSNVTYGGTALGAPVRLSGVITDHSNGRIYATCNSYNLCYLDRTTGKWVLLAGTGGTVYTSADSLLGSNISFPYVLTVAGINGTELFAYVSRWAAPSVWDSMMKTYSLTDGTQTHVAGNLGVSPGWCSSGSTAATCNVPTGGPIRGSYDGAASTPRWISVSQYSNIVRAIEPGGLMTSLVTLPRAPTAITYRRKATPASELLYYCGNDYKLYRYNLTTLTDTNLPLPSTSFQCLGGSLFYSTIRNSVVFIFTQNGLTGVAEYLDP